MHPIEVMPVFPDFKMWKHPAAHVIFDRDPSLNNGLSNADKQEQSSQAIIRGMIDENNKEFVGYFLATDKTRMKRRKDKKEGLDYDPEFTYDHKLARGYNCSVKNRISKGFDDNYFFVYRDGQVHYNELETKVRLFKRRTGAEMKAVLAINHRSNTGEELHAHQARKKELEPVSVNSEEGEEQEGDEENV